MYVGANRGRGQVYPWEKKLTTIYLLLLQLANSRIKPGQKEMEIVIAIRWFNKIQMVPNGLDLVVKVNQVVQVDQPLTTNPNVGGFGQTETEIVLQDPARIYGYLAFVISIIISQSMLVFKKKQFEKVQIAELDF